MECPPRRSQACLFSQIGLAKLSRFGSAICKWFPVQADSRAVSRLSSLVSPLSLMPKELPPASIHTGLRLCRLLVLQSSSLRQQVSEERGPPQSSHVPPASEAKHKTAAKPGPAAGQWRAGAPFSCESQSHYPDRPDQLSCSTVNLSVITSWDHQLRSEAAPCCQEQTSHPRAPAPITRGTPAGAAEGCSCPRWPPHPARPPRPPPRRHPPRPRRAPLVRP